MSAYKNAIDNLSGVLQPLIDLGLKLIMTFVVIDLLFPGTTGVVENLGVVTGQFSREGLAGLVALLLFVMVFKDNK